MFIQRFLIMLGCMALTACNSTYRTATNGSISPGVIQQRQDHSVYFAPKNQYLALPNCAQFLTSTNSITLYPAHSRDFLSAADAAEKSCSSRTGQQCKIVYREQRDLCVGQVGSCTPRLSNRIIESKCYIDQEQGLIAYERGIAAEKAAEERSNAAIAVWRSECAKMGFSADSSDIAGCVLSLKEMSMRAENHRRTQEAYDAQLAEFKKQREIDANLALMQFGLGIASGGSRNSGSSSSRALPTLPPPPPPITIVTPSGNRYSCSTFATTVTCR